MKNSVEHCEFFFWGVVASEEAGDLWFIISENGSRHRWDLCFLSLSLNPGLSGRLKICLYVPTLLFLGEKCCRKMLICFFVCLFIFLHCSKSSLWLIMSYAHFCLIVLHLLNPQFTREYVVLDSFTHK